jgi:hypothetical protein
MTLALANKKIALVFSFNVIGVNQLFVFYCSCFGGLLLYVCAIHLISCSQGED